MSFEIRKRYYRVLEDVLWDEASQKCQEDGAQLAMAYTKDDFKEMMTIGGGIIV